MITVENLTKRYGGFTAVDDISFEVRPGSVVGFLGPNGAGKSTAMRMMTGLTPPTSGRATILGQPYRDLLAKYNEATEAKTREKLLGDIQRHLAENAVNAYLFQLPQFAVSKKNLKGVWSSSPIFANDLAALSWQ